MAINLPIVSKFDDRGIKQAESAIGKVGKVAAGVAAAATAAIAGVATASVAAFAKFDDKLNQSIAIMGNVSDVMRNDMAEAAREVAKQTTFSADQAAESFFFLASAGLSAEASIKAMPEVAKFAQAGMFDMALATDLLTDAQSALGLTIRDDAVKNMENLTRVSDTLVKANTLANASVEQFSTALTTKAGAALRSLGKDVEEGVAVLAAFADQGIKGELAGTQLSIVLRDLSTKAIKNKDEFAAMGLEVFDANGEMRNLGDIVANLETALDGMSDETQKATLLQAGFSDKSLASLTALLGTSEAIKTYEKELRNASGTTQEISEKQLTSLSAQFELAKSRIQDVGISIGAALAPELLKLIRSIEPIAEEVGPELVKFFQGLAPVIAKVVAVIPQLMTILTAILPIFGGLFDIVMNIVDMALPILTSLITSLIPIVEALIVPLGHVLNTIFIPLMPAIQAVVEAILPLIEALLPVLVELLYAILPVFTQLLEAVIIPLTPALVAVAEAFMPILQEILPPLIDIIRMFLIPILGVLIELFKITLTGAIGAFKGSLQNLTQFLGIFGNTFKNIWNSISGFMKGIINGMIGFFEGFANTAIDAVNAIIRAVNSIKIDIPAFPPFFPGARIQPIRLATIPRVSIPRLAEGGIVMPQPGGVFANIAEAGKPEAVIPLDRMGKMGTTNNYNITVNAGLGADGGRIGQQIVDEIKRFERANGPVFASA
jgi:TP901 family phage tail tape measure protein